MDSYMYHCVCVCVCVCICELTGPGCVFFKQCVVLVLEYAIHMISVPCI